MLTDLFAAVLGLSPAGIAAAVPPACRRMIEAAPPPSRVGNEVVIEFGDWRPRAPACHLVPAFSALTDGWPSFRFEASVRTMGVWSPWVGATSLGRASFDPITMHAQGLRSDIDVFLVSPPAECVRVRLRVRADDAQAIVGGRWLVTLSASDLDRASAPRANGKRVRALAVPPLSQMAAPPTLGHRICSPTCVAMVLGYWGKRVEVTELAAEMFHPAHDLYGVWPAAIGAAARRGILGYLLRFPDWTSAVWCLERGLPIIASIRYAESELIGAPLAQTDGHLVVLTGCDGDDVDVNDPAAPARDSVARRYRRDQLSRVWLDRGGVGYVLFTPDLRDRTAATS